MTIGIYRIVNLLTDKSYVGQSINIEKRHIWHLCRLRSNKHTNIYLQRSYNEHGESNFKFEVLEIVEFPDTLNDSTLKRDYLIPYEQRWIDHFQSASRDYGYNFAPVAGTVLGRCMSDETRKKISDSLKGHGASDETRQKIGDGNRGKIVSQEVKDKMSQAMSKYKYVVTYPSGEIEEVRSLHRFCLIHNLQQTCMRRILTGKQKQHKGYKIMRVDSFDE